MHERRSLSDRLSALAALSLLLGCTNDYDGIIASAAATSEGGAPGPVSSGVGASGGGTGAQGGGTGTGGSGARAGSGGSPASSGGSGGAGGSGGIDQGTVTYTAVVAACLDPGNPDPTLCEAQSGADSIISDTEFTDGGGGPRHIYLRFDLDQQLQGKNLLSAVVRMTVTPNGTSDSSGSLWEVSGFTAASLEDAAPSYQGAGPLSPEQGAVAANAVVSWMLDSTAIIVAGAPAHFGIQPSSSDGTRYWNADGEAPPVLVVAYGP